jgi:enoyl-CoA hydratase
MSLMLDCDLRIASEAAQFSIPEARFGVIPGDFDVLERHMPPGVLRELLFTGDSISAQRACDIGLINRVVPPDKVLSEATALAEKLRDNSPLAIRGIKEMLSRSKELDYRSAVAIYGKVNDRVLKSEDLKEGMNAIKEKRKPAWQGK